jgi:serine/threonine protein kinase
MSIDFGLSRRIYTYTGDETMAMQQGEEAMVPALCVIIHTSSTCVTYNRALTMCLCVHVYCWYNNSGADDTLTTRVGTSLWMSPEMMTGQPYNGTTTTIPTIFI